MAYRIAFKPSARRELERLPWKIIERIEAAINALADDPRPAGCKKLADAETWRIRVGDYRVVYEIHDGVLVVLVLRIAHRKDIYR